jgi:hypothetical protein
MHGKWDARTLGTYKSRVRRNYREIHRKFYVSGASFAVPSYKKVNALYLFATLHSHGDPVARRNGMKLDFMVFVGALLAILFLGTVGAFLLYVPALTVLTVVTLLLGLGFMFALGIMTGRGWRRSSPFPHRAVPIIR